MLDTHDHADHLSGRLRLAAATGARAYCPDPERCKGGIAAGDEIAVGNVRVRALETPGHRPEHLAFEVTDLKRSEHPWMVLTGDSLLVGDIARPDLAYEAIEGATALHATLGKLIDRPGHVEVWPAHVGGSLCGGAGLSGKTSSTIGYERACNPLLSMDVEQFVQGLTADLPTRPPNIDLIVSLNRRTEQESEPEVPALGGPRVRELLGSGAIVLDARGPYEFDAGHLAGALNSPIGAPGVGTRAGWALSPQQPLVIAAADTSQARAMASALQAVGFFAIAGYTVVDLDAWGRAGLAVERDGAWDLDQLVAALRDNSVELVDVRELEEWAAGHVAGSQHLPLHRLRDVDSIEIPADGRTIAVACAAGNRAAFAASMLRRAGHLDVVRIADGGVPDLRDRGIELEQGLAGAQLPSHATS